MTPAGFTPTNFFNTFAKQVFPEQISLVSLSEKTLISLLTVKVNSTEWRTLDWCFILSLSMFKFSRYYLPDLWGTVRMLPTNGHQHKLLPSSFSAFLSFDFLKFGGVRFASLIWLIFFYLCVDWGDVIYFLFSLLLLPFCVLVQLITVFKILGILSCVSIFFCLTLSLGSFGWDAVRKKEYLLNGVRSTNTPNHGILHFCCDFISDIYFWFLALPSACLQCPSVLTCCRLCPSQPLAC